MIVDVCLLEADIFSFIKPHQNGYGNARPSKQELIQTHTKDYFPINHSDGFRSGHSHTKMKVAHWHFNFTTN